MALSKTKTRIQYDNREIMYMSNPLNPRREGLKTRKRGLNTSRANYLCQVFLHK